MIIGLLGYAGSGKDAVAEILVKEHGFKRRAFADKIRDFVYESGDYSLKTRVDHQGWDHVKKDLLVRRTLQETGMAARKVFGEDFWVEQALKDLHSYEHYVITDVRFQNEVDKLRFIGGRLWRVKRPGVGPVNDHISEHELDDCKVDQIINNQGTLDDLRELVNKRIELK